MNLEQTVTQSNLTLKIAKIMAELPEIEKQNVKFETRNGKNVFYKAYGIDQITGLLRQRIGESKISITPAITGVVEIKNNTWVQMEYTMIDGESGDTMVKPWLQPMSSGGSIDKDMGATLSYATKNFLMRTFMISPEGDPDIDTNPPPSDDGKQHQPGNGNKPAPTREPIVPPNKSKELHNTVQALRSLKVVGKHKQASYEGRSVW